MAVYTEDITLDGSGEATQDLVENINGYIEAIFTNKNGQTGNPTIDLTENGGMGQQVLNITESGASGTLYQVRKALVTNANAAITNSNGRYLVEAPLTATIASGDAAGTVTVTIQYEPLQR